MDERIREILRAIEKWTCGKREDKPLTHLRPNIGMGEEGRDGKTKSGGFRKEFERRKAPPSL